MFETEPTVELVNVSRIYGEKHALDNVSFSVHRGDLAFWRGKKYADAYLRYA